MPLRSKHGFTLIELMLVIAIVGVLSAIAMPNVLGNRMKAQDTVAKSEAINFYSTAMAHFADQGASTIFSATAIPNGFARNPEVNAYGSLRISSQGLVSGVVVFMHVKSSSVFWVWGSSGIVRGAQIAG